MKNIGSTPAPVVTHFAGRAGDRNTRAMAGSKAVAAHAGTMLGSQVVTIGQPQPALSAGWEEELSAARPELEMMAAHYHRLLENIKVPFTAMGRCAVSLATLPVIAHHRPDAVIVWFDAHADINTPESSDTGYLGGLALSGPLGLWDSGLGKGLSPQNAIIVGARDIDPFEQQLINEGAVTHVPLGPNLGERLNDVVAGRPVYVHLDCDVLEPGIVPTDYEVPDGLTLEELSNVAAVLAGNEIVGVEISELEAGDDGETGGIVRLMEALRPVLPLPRH